MHLNMCHCILISKVKCALRYLPLDVYQQVKCSRKYLPLYVKKNSKINNTKIIKKKKIGCTDIFANWRSFTSKMCTQICVPSF